jgi:very-short-patch-repair endonuclease
MLLILALASWWPASVTDPARREAAPGHFTGALGGPMSRPSHQRSAQLQVRAREMRVSPTLSEARLWQAPRASRLGVAFRRQVVIGDYIVDFLAPAVSLVVEVDGGYHAWRCRADARRDRVLERAGYRVLRLQAEVIMADLPRALAVIAERLG